VKLDGAVRPRPRVGGVAVFEERRRGLHLDGPPACLPRVAVDAVALRRAIERLDDGPALEGKAAVADAIGVGDEREGRGLIGKALVQRAGGSRA
jgi:hypothetical protein